MAAGGGDEIVSTGGLFMEQQVATTKSLFSANRDGLGDNSGSKAEQVSGKHNAMQDNIHTQSEQRDRPRNEDRSWAGKIKLADKSAVWVAMVADGVGGHRFGAEVAEMAIQALRQAIEHATARDFANEGGIRAWLMSWGPKLQDDVQEAYPVGFSTLCAAIQIEKAVILLSVGDSPVFQVSAGAGVRRVFEAHTRGQIRLRNGEDEEDVDSRDFSVLTRAVGLRQEGEGPLLDFQRVTVTEPTWFLLGSDGVFNYLEGIELFQTLSSMKRPGASDIAETLLAHSLQNGRKTGKHLDNATIAVLGVLQKNGRKARLVADHSQVRTGGKARLAWIVALICLLTFLVGVLAGVYFLKTPIGFSVPSIKDHFSESEKQNEPVSPDNGQTGDLGVDTNEDSVTPLPTDAFQEPPTLLPPEEDAISEPTLDATTPVNSDEEEDIPVVESLPAKVSLRLKGTKTEVTDNSIMCAYTNHSPRFVERTMDYYFIPDAQNVELIELEEVGPVYYVDNTLGEDHDPESIVVWYLIPREPGAMRPERLIEQLPKSKKTPAGAPPVSTPSPNVAPVAEPGASTTPHPDVITHEGDPAASQRTEKRVMPPTKTLTSPPPGPDKRPELSAPQTPPPHGGVGP